MIEQSSELLDPRTLKCILKWNWVLGSLYINRFVDTLTKQWLRKRLEVSCG